MILTSLNPFPGNTRENVIKLIIKNELNFNLPIFEKMSLEAIDFI